MKEKNNIVKFHRQIHINVGLVICLIIFIYILFHLYTYLTRSQISVYEVRQGQIVSNYEYQALALRNEMVVYSEKEGYPIYYVPNRTMASVRTKVYAIDDTGDIVKKLNESKDSGDKALFLSKESLNSVKNNIYSFENSYNENRFQRVYDFKEELCDLISDDYSRLLLFSMGSDINSAIDSERFHEYKAPASGFLVYQTDGYEDVFKEDVNLDLLDPGKVSETQLKTDEKIDSGTPVYKLLTDDNWDLFMDVPDDVFNTLSEGDFVKVHFEEDDSYSYGTVSYIKNAGHNILDISLKDSAERYFDKRFIAIELMLSEKSGLKIPNSSIVEKEFFAIPKEYFIQGNDSEDYGLLKALPEDDKTEFITPVVYYETDDEYYIDRENFSDDDYIIKADTGEKYKVSKKTEKLKGVYNINKGYAVFKQIEILYQSSDHSIIKTGTKYGISLYDRIVLQGDKVEENEIL